MAKKIKATKKPACKKNGPKCPNAQKCNKKSCNKVVNDTTPVCEPKVSFFQKVINVIFPK